MREIDVRGRRPSMELGRGTAVEMRKGRAGEAGRDCRRGVDGEESC